MHGVDGSLRSGFQLFVLVGQRLHAAGTSEQRRRSPSQHSSGSARKVEPLLGHQTIIHTTDNASTSYTMSLKELISQGEFARVEQLLTTNGGCADQVEAYNLFSQKSQSYPLHYLCRKKETPLSTMKAMMEASPAKAFVYRDSVGLSTPLHLAIWYSLPVDVILLLMEASREAVLIQDVDGNLPIHLASALHPEADRLVPALLELHPATALVRNSKGQTPLHCLCTLHHHHLPIKVLKDLIAVGPRATTLKDRMGRLPLHHACLQQADLSIMECLVRAHPASVNVSDHSALTPYGIVRRRWQCTNTDPRVQLLRKGMVQSSCLPVAIRNKIQFKLEDLSTKKRSIAVRPCPVTVMGQ